MVPTGHISNNDLQENENKTEERFSISSLSLRIFYVFFFTNYSVI